MKLKQLLCATALAVLFVNTLQADEEGSRRPVTGMVVGGPSNFGGEVVENNFESTSDSTDESNGESSNGSIFEAGEGNTSEGGPEMGDEIKHWME